MCKTPVQSTSSSSCFPKHNNSTFPLHCRKRVREDHSSTFKRSARRVTFSSQVFVLGQAQVYDSTASIRQPICRTSLEQSSTTTSAMGSTPGNASFCGMWRRSHGFNWATLLELSGVATASIPEQMARMQSSSVVHLIDHDDVSFRLVVHSDSGTTQDQHFFIGGHPQPTASTGRAGGGGGGASNNSSTLASMRWASNGQVLVLTSVDAASGDEMTVSRHLASQDSVMVQHYRARCARTGETAEAVTIFRRMTAGRSDSEEST